MSESHDPARLADHDIAEMEARLHLLADHFVARSRVAGPDAIELFDRGTLLHRAAFALRAERSTETIDLRREGE